MRPHGVIGEMRVRLMTDYPERLKMHKQVFLGHDPMKANAKAYEVVATRFHQDHWLIRLRDVLDRNQAELLRGLYVMTELDNAIPLDDDEFYLYELIGMSVETEDGQLLGKLTDIMETGANDVFILQSERYGELLVPAHEQTIVDILREQQRIIMTLPEGLLPADE